MKSKHHELTTAFKYFIWIKIHVLVPSAFKKIYKTFGFFIFLISWNLLLFGNLIRFFSLSVAIGLLAIYLFPRFAPFAL